MDHLTSKEKQKINAMNKAVESLLEVIYYGPSIFKNDIDHKCNSLIADLLNEIIDIKE